MSELMGGDDMFALFNGTQIMLQQSLPMDQAIDLPGSSEWIVSKPENIPIVKVDRRQIAIQLSSGEQLILDVVNGLGNELVMPDVLEDESCQVTSDLVETQPVQNTNTGLKSFLVQNDLNSELTFVEMPQVPDSQERADQKTQENIFNKALKNIITEGDTEDEEMPVLNQDSSEKICDLNEDLSKGSVKDVPDNSEISVSDIVETFTLYKCKICTFSTDSEEELSGHLSQMHLKKSKTKLNLNGLFEDGNQEKAKPSGKNTESYVFLCVQCTAAFKSIEQCRDHMIKDHNMIFKSDCQEEKRRLQSEEKKEETVKSTPSCADTNKSNVEDLKVEKKIVPKTANKTRPLKSEIDFEVRPFKCKYHKTCIHKFRTSDTLALHVACHNEEEPKYYSCSCCNEGFEKWYPCAMHLWNTHRIDVDLFTCNICEVYKTTTSKKLENHVRIHRDVKEFTCPDCGKKFKQKSQMRNHQVSTHKDKNVNVTPRWYMSKKCEICYKTYADSKCLKIHMQTVHSKLKPYVCHVCGHSSARKAMWKSHVRQHTGEKPYACTICSFKTGDHNSLRRHTMRHSGMRPYQCPHCPYNSIQSASFKNHVSSRHPGKEGIFGCRECNFTTVNQDSFVQHLLDHKNNLIAYTSTVKGQEKPDVEVFPENVAAAQLVYRCLGALPARLQSDVTASSTSPDGTKQTITIEIPPRELQSTDDEDTTHCFLLPEEYDTGGITIPAEADSSMLCFQ